MNSIYDNNDFFERYASMDRSREGLDGAGEWHQLRVLFPDLRGSRMLDLGCGFGWHCLFAAQQGAAAVEGIDSSEKMIEGARERNPHPAVRYRVCGLEEYEYPENSFDFILSSLVLHYIHDLNKIYANVFGALRPGGVFLFSIEHPVFTAGVGQDWLYGEDGRPLCWPIDDYFRPGKRQTGFLGAQVEKEHHTLTQILMGLIQTGFCLEAVVEAMPSDDMLDRPGMRDELRRPMMLLVRARKGKA